MIHNYLILTKPYPGTLLFISTRNKPLEPNVVQSFLKRYARLAGINKNVTPHSVRATFASPLVTSSPPTRGGASQNLSLICFFEKI